MHNNKINKNTINNNKKSNNGNNNNPAAKTRGLFANPQGGDRRGLSEYR